MREYNINGKKVSVDETKQYRDFYLEDGQPCTFTVEMCDLCEALESGGVKWDACEKHVRMLARWVVEAPRKRELRKMRLEGYTILTGEYLFEDERGAAFIDALENAGIVAAAICEAYGSKPVKIDNDGPFPVDAGNIDTREDGK